MFLQLTISTIFFFLLWFSNWFHFTPSCNQREQNGWDGFVGQSFPNVRKCPSREGCFLYKQQFHSTFDGATWNWITLQSIWYNWNLTYNGPLHRPSHVHQKFSMGFTCHYSLEEQEMTPNKRGVPGACPISKGIMNTKTLKSRYVIIWLDLFFINPQPHKRPINLIPVSLK